MDLEFLTGLVVAFRNARDWQQFHLPNQLASAVSIEAAELQEQFLWKSPEEVASLSSDASRRVTIGEELADVLIYSLLLAHELNLDPAAIIQDKLAKNAAKYPVEKARGSASKYTELR